ncbi:MAG: hypothetical protein IJW40_03850 [Clostridia bacterium]|nr:hypothetical protein [Clostridia bacterium]
MRKEAAQTKNQQIYVRFHTRVDEALTRASESTGLKRATLTAWILETYVRRVNTKIEKGEICLLPNTDAAPDGDTAAPLSAEALGLSSLASLYALKIGRTAGHAPRSIGKPILLTLTPEIEGQLHLLADLCGMSINHFRSAVVATFLIEQNVLT